MSGDMVLSDFFSDIGMVDSDVQSWVPEVFDNLDDHGFITDDLLTDTISECIKPKSDGLLNDYLNNADDFFVGDEIEIKDSSLLSIEKDLLNSDGSSGYASCVTLSNTSSPVNSLRLKSESPDVDKYALISNLNPKLSSKTINITRIEPSYNDVNFKNQLQNSHIKFVNTTPGAKIDNRVHFILRPYGANSGPKNKQLISSNDYQQTPDINTDVCNIFSTNKLCNGKILTPPQKDSLACDKHESHVFNHSSHSSVSTGSQSSSESDSRDIFEDYLSTRSALNDYCGDQHASKVTRYSVDKNTFKRQLNFTSLNYYDEPMVNQNGYSDVNGCNDSLNNLTSSKLCSQQHVYTDQMNHSSLLVLSEEEKRTLLAEGYPIPCRLPLSKQDERNLKKVRRKIKNKISAQESRRKKKEYLETLERKVSIYSQENVDLKRRVDGLESTNRSLLGQLRLLQQVVSKSRSSSDSVSHGKSRLANSSGANMTTTNTATGSSSSSNTSSTSVGSINSVSSGGGSASTCLMVFALCFAALLVGQPVTTNRAHSNGGANIMDIGLSYSAQTNNLLNTWNLLKNPKSFGQMGYTIGNNHQRSKVLDSDPNNSNAPSQIQIRQSDLNAQTSSSFLNSCSGDENSCRPSEHYSLDRPVLSMDQSSTSSTGFRSRLLDSAASDSDDCATPVQSFWTTLFEPNLSCKFRTCDVVNNAKSLSLSRDATDVFVSHHELGMKSSQAANDSTQHWWSLNSGRSWVGDMAFPIDELTLFENKQSVLIEIGETY